MLGRVRSCSLSSLEVLEMERTPSKLLKDDSLSIYEKTLLKLQQGSRLDLSLISEESTNTDTSCSMDTTMSSNETSVVMNAPDNASADSSSSDGNAQSIIILKGESRGNLLVDYMFSKYKTSKSGNISSSDDSAIAMEDCSSANTSPDGCVVDPPSPIV